MKQNILILLIVLSFIIFLNRVASALNITVSPNTFTSCSVDGVNVSITGYTPTCGMLISVDSGYPRSFGCGPEPCTPTVAAMVGICNQPPGPHTINLSTTGCGNPPDPTSTTYTILCPSLNITSSNTLPAGITGKGYSKQIQTSGGQTPITYSLVSGSLPPGLSLSSTGLISGTPTTAGTYNFTVMATDSCSLGVGAQTTQKRFSLLVVGKFKPLKPIIKLPDIKPVFCRGKQATIIGTPGNDKIQGTPGNDVIHGLGGNDIINGLGGNDTICGGNGNDTLMGGQGNNHLYGDSGNDTLNGVFGKSYCDGGTGTDSGVSCKQQINIP